MRARCSRIVSLVGVVGAAMALSSVSGCVSYGNTHALITPVGVAGYHTFKPTEPARDLPPTDLNQTDPDRVAAAKPKREPAQEAAADDDT